MELAWSCDDPSGIIQLFVSLILEGTSWSYVYHGISITLEARGDENGRIKIEIEGKLYLKEKIAKMSGT